MIDLSTQPELPRYELTGRNGEIKSFDSLIVSFELRVLDGEDDPAKIRERVNEVFGLEVDAFIAMAILEDFAKFAEENLEEPLKKVFGRELFSASSTDSRPPTSEA